MSAGRSLADLRVAGSRRAARLLRGLVARGDEPPWISPRVERGARAGLPHDRARMATIAATAMRSSRWLRAGARQPATPTSRIEVARSARNLGERATRSCWNTSSNSIVTGETTRRRSTALFLASPAAPRGVVWRHLQETWMEAD